MKASEIRCGGIYYLDGKIKELEYADFSDFAYLCDKCTPIPLTEQWLIKCNVKMETILGETWGRRFIDNIEIPKWITTVHDLQNWYYYHFEKKELIIK